MKVLLVSVGTRGDMEPFLAIGELLKAQGHEVTCAFPEQFQNLAEQSGLAFASLGKKFIELLTSEAGQAAMGGATGWKKAKGMLQLIFRQKEANQELLFRQRDHHEATDPEIVLYSGKAVYPPLWKLKTGKKTIFINPVPYMHYSQGHAHMAFNGNYGAFLNRLTFALTDFGLAANILMSQKWLRWKPRYSRRQILQEIRQTPCIYTVSPTLHPQPADWPGHVKVLGHRERSLPSEWEPDEALRAFIARHPKILFVTFGSMANANPQKNTQVLLDLLQHHQIPAIINTADGGGLRPPAGFQSQLVHFVRRIPYDWVFPQMHAVIHHGGSGTTHMAVKCGCASMAIPHILDQFAWNDIQATLGVGPKGIKINKLSLRTLEPRLLDLWNNPAYKQRAEQAAKQMAQEDFTAELLRVIAPET
ncbi:MAG: nucleotide disphospho-sugar-binding domain-containing protein [Bacteroidota bacterium]